MHWITLTSENNPFGFEPGKRYLLDNAPASVLLMDLKGKDLHAADIPPPHFDEGKVPESLLIIRAGGIGDLVFLTPTLATLRARYPDLPITVASHARYHAALNHPDLDGIQLIDMDLTEDIVFSYDWIIPMDDLIETNDVDNAIDIYATAILGSPDRLADRKCRIAPTTKATRAVAQKLPRWSQGERRVGIQITASHACRSYPMDKLSSAMLNLVNHDAAMRLYVLAPPGLLEKPAAHPQIVWLIDEEHGLGLDEVIALIADCDGFVGPDSGLTHIAGAMGIPTVALFGSYHWKQRVGDFKSVRAIQGTRCPIGPCHHKARNRPWPVNGPCNQIHRCLALDLIPPDQVARTLRQRMADHRVGSAAAGTSEPTDKPAPRETLQRDPLAICSRFGGTEPGDAHPELKNAGLYHLGDWGYGAANVEEAEVLFALVAALKPRICIETGTESGWTAAHIGGALAANDRGHLWTLELDAKMAQKARDNLDLAGIGSRVSVVQEESFTFLARWEQDHPGKKIDFALLDTHIELRARELEMLRPLLAEGAVVAVHDTSPDHPYRKGQELLKDLRATGMPVIHLATPRGLTLLQESGRQGSSMPEDLREFVDNVEDHRRAASQPETNQC